MSALSPTNSNASSNTLENLLTCPVSYTPLTDAYHLHPCAHKVGEVALSHISQCPLCRAPIQAAYPDHLTRNLATDWVLNGQPNRSILPQQPPFYYYTYLGKPAVFTEKNNRLEPSWTDVNIGQKKMTDTCKVIEFVTQSHRPFFNTFRILGIRDGSIQVFIRGDDEEMIEIYLSTIGFQKRKHYDFQWGYHFFTEHIEIQHIYRLLVANNTFPKEWLNFLSNIIEKGKWA